MILSLVDVEKILIDENFFKSDELKKLKESRLYGKGRCRVLGTFKRAVKTDYNLFFPEKPCSRNLNKNAEKLFRVGGDRDFPKNLLEERPEEILPSPEPLTFEQSVQADLIHYREDSELETSVLSQTQEKYVKQSQERYTPGKGKNNPRLSEETRYDCLIQFAADTPISAIHENAKNFIEEFKRYQDPHDEQSRQAPSLASLYRWKKDLEIANNFQLEEFVENAERLTISTDGTTSRSNREVIAIVLVNENREKIVHSVVELFGKTAAELTAALEGSINQLKFANQLWAKVDSLLTDTCPAQLCSNKEVIEIIRKRREDPDLVIDQLWCTLHTASNIDKYARDAITQAAKTALTALKILFGSSTTSGYHRDDIKNRYCHSAHFFYFRAFFILS